VSILPLLVGREPFTKVLPGLASGVRARPWSQPV